MEEVDELLLRELLKEIPDNFRLELFIANKANINNGS